jgi:uncharacterized DUF497 family protein
MLEIADSARRHRISDDRIRFVVEHCGLVFHQPASADSPGGDRLIYLGDDEHSVPLEIVAVESKSGEIRVIHAMKLRPQYQKEYEEALPWRKLSSS